MSVPSPQPFDEFLDGGWLIAGWAVDALDIEWHRGDLTCARQVGIPTGPGSSRAPTR